MGFGRDIVVAGFHPLISEMNKKIKEKIYEFKKNDVQLNFYNTIINQDVNKKLKYLRKILCLSASAVSVASLYDGNLAITLSFSKSKNNT